MTQTETLFNHLKKGWVTPLDALLLCGCMRLAARIHDLRQDGVNVVSEWREANGKKFKAYKVIV